MEGRELADEVSIEGVEGRELADEVSRAAVRSFGSCVQLMWGMF